MSMSCDVVDADPAGIVWFGVFFRYFGTLKGSTASRQRPHDALRDLGVHAADVAAIALPIPAKLGVSRSQRRRRRDHRSADQLRSTSMNAGPDRLICEGRTRGVCVDAKTFARNRFHLSRDAARSARQPYRC
jgi:acyl-CoA thioesterase FadM